MGIAWEVVTWNNWILSGYYVGLVVVLFLHSNRDGMHYKL